MRVLVSIALCLAVFVGGGFSLAQATDIQDVESTKSRIPVDAPRAVLMIDELGDLRLNGRLSRLASGGQIRNEANRIVLPQGLITKRPYLVRVKLTPDGGMRQAWILTDEEKVVPAPLLK